MSSRVPSAFPLTRRESAQNASWAEVNAPELAGPGQGGGAGQGAGFGFEDLEVVVQLDRAPGPGRDPLMPGSHCAAVEHHDPGRHRILVGPEDM
ncbi:hypothetical protein ABIB51_002994 [Arthrobacter sp. UYCu712]